MIQSLRLLSAITLCLFSSGMLLAQEPIKKRAFSGVHVHHIDGKVKKNASILWNEQLLETVGKANTDLYLTIDGGDSLHVYPGFIDGYGTHGSPKTERAEKVDDPGNPPLERAGIESAQSAHELWDEKSAKGLESALKQGILLANLAPNGFMIPGKMDLTLLQDAAPLVILPESGMAASLSNAPGGWRNGVYPSTLMGVMSRYRQLWYDAQALHDHIEHYEAGRVAKPPVRNQALEAMFPYLKKEKPLFIVANTPEDIERIFKLQNELDFNWVLVSGKMAHHKAVELKERNIPVLATFTFDGEAPKKKKNKKDREELSDEQKAFMERKEAARNDQIQNIKNLMKSDVKVGYASYGEEKKDFMDGMKAMMEADYKEEELLAVLTKNTAEILGVFNQVGSLEKGKMANFFVTDKPITEEKFKILYTVSGGVLKDHTKN